MAKLVTALDLVLAATLGRLLPRVVTLLGEALQVVRVEEQLGVAAVRELVIDNLSLGRTTGVKAAFAEWLPVELRVP